MSWSDPARRFEPAEDAALRAELRDLLGLGPQTASQAADSTPELRTLADDLRREALRRRRTERRRPTWGLLAAAALPLLAALAGLGSWGLQQKQRADGLSAQAAQQQQELARQAEAHASALAQERQAREVVQQQLQVAFKKGSRKTDPYLVIPIEKAMRSQGEDYQRVKQAPGQ